ncbi:MAG: gamma carbonic anhydrase family protein [Flavobacteriales bacterium]|nr:gamma carbonic anhydrase family protein [Flavobacteriales bacterium]
MALLKSVRGFTPQIGENCFLAENATLIGDVVMGNDCSIWYSAVVRGDVNSIVLGNKVNIQDGAVIHCTYEKSKTILGNNVSVGHNAIVHGCEIHDNVLVGMGSIVMDNVIVESNVIIAAGAVVTQNSRLESGFIYAGTPAKKIKALSENLKTGEIERIANNYLKYSSWFK